MATQGIRAVIRSGESAKNLGAPEAEYHIYVDSVNGDDSNEGFGTDDPTDSANWAKAVQTGDKARLLVPRAGTTYIHTRGNVEVTTDYYPYPGYQGQCYPINYDEFEEVATGTIASVNASTDDIQWGEMTVNWDGGFVPTDAVLRQCWALVTYDDSTVHTHKILEWTDPGAGGLGIRLADNITASVSIGNAVQIVRPDSSFTMNTTGRRYQHVINTYFVGYNVVIGDGRWGVKDGNSDGHFISGFGMCQISGPTNTDFGSLWERTGTDLAFHTVEMDGVVNLYLYDTTQVWGNEVGNVIVAGGNEWERFSVGNLLTVIRSLVIDGRGLFLTNGQLQAANVRVVEGLDSSWTNLQNEAQATFYNSKLANLYSYPGCWLYFGNGIGLHTQSKAYGSYNGTECLMLLESGCVVDGHTGTKVFVEGDPVDKYIAVFWGVDSNEVKFTAASDLATPATPLPAFVIDGGHHADLRFDCGAMDRGAGPTLFVDGNASGDLAQFNCPTRETLKIGSGAVVETGDLELGSAATPNDVDTPCLEIETGGRLVVDGTLDLYRDVAATTVVLSIADSTSLECSGNVTVNHAGGGDSNAVQLGTGGAHLKCADLTIATDQDGGFYSTGIYFDGNCAVRVGGDFALTMTGNSIYLLWFSTPAALFEVRGTSSFIANNTSGAFAAITMERQTQCIFSGAVTVSGTGLDQPIFNIDATADIRFHDNVTINTPNNTELVWDVDGHVDHTRGSRTVSVTTGTPDTSICKIGGRGRMNIHGTYDLASCGVPSQDGGAFWVGSGGYLQLDQLQFNGGADLDLGAFASVYAERGAEIHVTDETGVSDAINNNGGAAARGIRLRGGAKAYLPPWAANTGIGVPAADPGSDHQIGGNAADNWGGGEILEDTGAADPELCMAYKPV